MFVLSLILIVRRARKWNRPVFRDPFQAGLPHRLKNLPQMAREIAARGRLKLPARRSRRNCSSSLLLPQLCDRRGWAGQHDPKLREVPWLRLDLDRVSVLLD